MSTSTLMTPEALHALDPADPTDWEALLAAATAFISNDGLARVEQARRSMRDTTVEQLSVDADAVDYALVRLGAAVAEVLDGKAGLLQVVSLAWVVGPYVPEWRQPNPVTGHCPSQSVIAAYDQQAALIEALGLTQLAHALYQVWYLSAKATFYGSRRWRVRHAAPAHT